ncbi:DUF4365 domain-containing protein [Paenibacillus lautus]|uniref:DUF4365 domain-containing protein n=1 Tax=Paenibacillus lautus TaxID=1401 RepID=UPI003D29CF47
MYQNNGNIGVAVTNLKVSQDLGWIFREQPTQDFGIDAHIEIHSGLEPTGKLIALQIKSGPSYFKEENDENLIFRGDMRHLKYWKKHSLPVLIVLTDIQNHICYWQQVTDDKVEIISDKSWKIEVPKKNKLNEQAKYDLERIADNLTEYQRRFNSLVIAKAWMEAIDAGDDVILESDEWIHKSSGKGSMTLKIISQTMEEKVALDWPMVFFPMQDYKDVFNKVFPWANISIDEDFYEDYDQDQFMLEECPYDSEEGEYIFVEEWYEEWKDAQEEIRPYSNSAGEVDHYRLKFELNDLGITFLKLDRYLESQFFYTLNDNDVD